MILVCMGGLSRPGEGNTGAKDKILCTKAAYQARDAQPLPHGPFCPFFITGIRHMDTT